VTTRDDELLDVLAASLGPPPDTEPTWPEISHLHRVIDHSSTGRRSSRAPLWRVRRPLTAALAGFLVLGGASAAAAASGAVMPEPVRVAARAVGLPVDSPQLAGTRAALARLRDALSRQPRDLSAIRSSAQEVRNRLARLSADDRAQVDAEATVLLTGADAALSPPPTPLGAPPAPVTPSNASPAPASPTPAAAGDDHGRNQPAADSGEGRANDDHTSGDDNANSSVQSSGSGVSGPSPSASSDGGDHTATTIQGDNSGHDGSSSDGGSSHDGGGSSGSDGGHSGPG